MNIAVTIKKVIQKGCLIGQDLFLICRGTKLNPSDIVLKSKYCFHDALICQNFFKSIRYYFNRDMPLYSQIKVVLKVHTTSHHWPVSLSIDFKHWHFSVIPHH